MRTFAAFMLAVLLGSLLGFYGVTVSVFADGPLPERILTICAVLLVYMTISLILGYLYPELSWKLGMSFGFPGAIFLAFFILNETSPFYFFYTLLLLFIPFLFTGVGKNLKTRNEII